jgi:hypothetical protein
MKIALFQPHNMLACHYSLFGYRETLMRMGHEVIECAFPGNQPFTRPQQFAEAQAAGSLRVPMMSELLTADLILSAYHEYTQPWLEPLYGHDKWKHIMQHTPVLARFDESMDRHDLHLPHRMPQLLEWATHYSFPAAQDAKKYGGEWHPFGADTTIFHPEGNHKRIDLGFIGTVYPSRKDYLTKLLAHIGHGRVFTLGNVFVQDIDGIDERETTYRLAKNYREIKIFFCLPPMSRLIIEKVFDIMACDTLVMFPRFPGDAAENYTLFEDDKHIVYYEYGFYANNGKQVKFYADHPEETERIAKAGGELVRYKYTLEKMLEAMLKTVEVGPRIVGEVAR